MDKILASLEELFFRIVALTFFIPKTIWLCFYNSRFSYTLVQRELSEEGVEAQGDVAHAKNGKSPFQDYASPIQVYLFAIIVPLYLVIQSSWDHPPFICQIQHFLADRAFLTVLAGIAIFSSFWPMAQTLVSLLFSKNSTRKYFQLYYFTYLYNFSVSLIGPIVLFLFGSLVFPHISESLNKEILPYFTLLVGCVWFITVRKSFLANIFCYRQFHLGVSYRKAFLVMLSQYFVFLIVYCLLFFVSLKDQYTTC